MPRSGVGKTGNPGLVQLLALFPLHVGAAQENHQFPGPGGHHLGGPGDGVSENDHLVIVFAPGFVHDPAVQAGVADDVAGEIHRVAGHAMGREHAPEPVLQGTGEGSGVASPRFSASSMARMAEPPELVVIMRLRPRGGSR